MNLKEQHRSYKNIMSQYKNTGTNLPIPGIPEPDSADNIEFI